MPTELAAPLDLTGTVGFLPTDIFTSALSLAGNFWPFLLLGLSFVITPWLFGIVRSALAKRSGKHSH